MSPVRIHHRFDWAQTTPSAAIVAVIAIIENVDPMDLEFVLYNYVDPGALDSLVSNDAAVALSFRIERYNIRIDGNELTVRRE
ncbi:HalOD1 output domain-containing protein [Halopiger aswanensis]|uniref:Halobacterial output domain-containing protein n=1 Tax=Halopiger aswanensis TaxID=148449 RepID=A0A3R7EDB6_9EURY|nr:HalOD1 output domain-containing protein [Halopiger aswanensis]RKD93470.1 hypothetical protein ATJ93_3094 [Halopiger aswanensis]